MSDLSSASSSDQVLAEFLREYEAAEDPQAVLRRYCEDHPSLKEELTDLVSLGEQVDQSRPSIEAEAVQPGDLLGEFRIVRKISQGGMGEIYEALQESLGRPVAIKTIRRGRLSPGARARFLREQRVLARLHQTHIVPIHTAGQSGPLQYFAMPYIEGAGLHHLIQSTLNLESGASHSRTPSLAVLAGKLSAESRHATRAGSHTVATSGAAVPADPAKAAPASEEIRPSVPSPLPSRFTLSMEYFRSAAQVMVDAAEALEHAHSVKILHRDVKPSNILVDTRGQCWLIDFGLAGYLNGAHGKNGVGQVAELGPEPVSVTGVAGTPQYMAPEQFAGRADVRSDVWGLGVTLYELLTLRRAFEGPSSEANEAPPLGERVSNVPPDLEAICRRAMQKDPAQRYATAGDFAEDLRRWLRHEPTVARPARLPRRVYLWARRNKGWAAAVSALVLASLALGGWAIAGFKAEAAEAMVKAAKAEAVAAVAREREEAAVKQADVQRREVLLQQLQRLRLTTPADGWSREAWRLVEDIAKLGRDANLRDQATGSFFGLDAVRVKEFPTEASSVAFDRTGRRLLMGGMSEPQMPARVWDSTTGEEIVSQRTGKGDVTFAKDGTPLQLIRQDKWTLVLWDLNKQRAVSTMSMLGQNLPDPNDQVELSGRDLSHDGERVAASISMPSGRQIIMVWDSTNGRLLRAWEAPASVFTFSPDNQVLALGDATGRLTLWSLATGKQLALLQTAGMALEALAFSPDTRFSQGKEPFTGRLAVGDRGANVVIWDLASGHPIAYCRGSTYIINALTFSPDGTLLASTGRSVTKVWDSATGRLLLDLHRDNFLTGLAFSPDGKKLAVSTLTVFGTPGRVVIWELQRGRGIQTLRGLSGQVELVRFSPDGRFMAAFTHDWQVAVWELAGGRFLFKAQLPIGEFVDNAALVYRPDSARLAFAGHKAAKVWDVTSGKELGSWTLPPGLQDNLAFHEGKLYSFRVETKEGREPPFTHVSSRRHPRVCRIRILAAQGATPIKVIEDFNKHIFGSHVSIDGNYLIIDGEGGVPGNVRRQIKAFDGRTGREVWAKDSRLTNDAAGYFLDPQAKVVLIRQNDPTGPADRLLKVDLANGAVLDTVVEDNETRTFFKRYWIASTPDHPNAMALYRRRDRALLLHLGLDAPWGVLRGPTFNAAETHLAWGKGDGTVDVCDLAEVQRRLAQVGLDW
jgi:serine/threonine protein kinase/WD40 repeat protein